MTEWLLETACGSILLNVASDIIFLAALSALFWMLWYRRVLARARRFFGTDQQTQVQVYISVHEDKETLTKKVVTAEEYEAAVESKDTLERQLRGSWFGKLAVFVAGLLGLDPRIPELVVSVSPSTELNAWPSPGSLILIGGPVRNQVTKFYLKDTVGELWPIVA